MASMLKLPLLLILLSAGVTYLNAFTFKDDFDDCEDTVKKWASSSAKLESSDDKHTLQELLFFLHIPRTGGRTYFHCFLKKLYSNNLVCPRSYDKLRFDPSKKCRLLVTHDDYSVTSKLPKQKTSIVTILRNPLDRVFSTYEFSIEVAARFLVHPTLESAIRMGRRAKLKNKGVSTLDIWPWKYLVPWMREDLFGRRDARKSGSSNSSAKNNDLYSMEDVVMPLYEYVNDPMAKEIIHNGATFQVVGLTNNSYMAESHEVRHCVQRHQTLGQYVLEVAKRRLDEMLYVGLTESHRESATIFANVVGAQVISQMTPLDSNTGSASNASEESSSLVDSEQESNHYINSTSYQNTSTANPAENFEAAVGNLTVEKLMEAYGGCISNLRKSQLNRRNLSLKKIANFTKEARQLVSKAVLEHIVSLNSLDVELYKYAQDIFARQGNSRHQKPISLDRQEKRLSSFDTSPYWMILSTVIIIMLLLGLLLLINAKRRISKVKI